MMHRISSFLRQLSMVSVAVLGGSVLLSAQQISDGFGDIALGDSLQNTVQKIMLSDFFSFNEAEDVSIIPSSANSLITTQGVRYIQEGFFQFDTDALVSIHLILNGNYIDHFSLFTFLMNTYGQPQILTPHLSTWESDTVRISLEKPLTIKYVDLQYFLVQQKERTVQESESQRGINEFLEQL